jgi:hypothetical protein
MGRDDSTTNRAASTLNSGLYFLRFSCIYRPPFRTGPYWVPYPESGRRACLPDELAERPVLGAETWVAGPRP